MKRKYLSVLAVILFSFNPLFAFNAGITAAASDSVNIKQLLLSQIQRAKEKENKKQSASEITSDSRNAEVQPVRKNAGFSEDLFLKLFILVDSALSVFLFVLWRRRKIKNQIVEKKQLKNNIMKLRQEKLIMKSGSRKETNRKSLKLEPVFNMASDNDQLFVSHAKKLSVSVGELQLAARISSYERDRE